MRWWPFGRRRRDPATVEAIKQVDAQIAKAKARDPEVKRLAARLRQIREHNNFADQIAAALREHR
jgi:hypothetical protein